MVTIYFYLVSMKILSKLNLTKISPIKKNIFSTFFGVAIQLFTQVVLVPFYIICWGNDLYSDWIVLSAITGFFSVTDIGLTTVTVNRFSIEFAKGDYKACHSLLTNSIVLLTTTFLICFILLIPILVYKDIRVIAGLHAMTRVESTIIVLLFLFKIFLGMMGAIYNSIYRATSNASKGMMAVNISKILEGVFMVICLVSKVPVIITAFFFVLPSFLLYVYIKINTTTNFFKYSFSLKYIDTKLFKELLIPSFSFMAFPLCQAINTQGMTLIVNAFFGSNTVVLFNTTRTLVNFVKSIITNLQNAIWPEFTVAYANKQIERAKNIARKTFQSSFIVSIIFAVLLSFLGSYIYEIWTRGQIKFDLLLMSILMMSVVADSFWSSSRLILNATNNHIKVGPLYLILTIISIILSYYVGLISSNLYLCLSCLLLIDIIMAPYTINLGLKLTKDKFVNLFSIK